MRSPTGLWSVDSVTLRQTQSKLHLPDAWWTLIALVPVPLLCIAALTRLLTSNAHRTLLPMNLHAVSVTVMPLSRPDTCSPPPHAAALAWKLTEAAAKLQLGSCRKTAPPDVALALPLESKRQSDRDATQPPEDTCSAPPRRLLPALRMRTEYDVRRMAG